MVKAIFFDLDGTICNTLEDLACCCNRALEDFGFPAHPTEEYKYIVGNGVDKQMERAIPKDSYSKDIAEKVKARFLEYYATGYKSFTRPYDGIADTLDELLNMGIRLAVFSNKPDEFTKEIVKTMFPGQFEMAVGNRPGKPTKPNPEVLLDMMGALGVKPDECLYCGDSGVDMQTAKAAGLYKIGVLWGFRQKDELMENGADALAEYPGDLLAIVKEVDQKR